MAKHLTEPDQRAVVRLIEQWEGKLTWDRLVDKYAQVTGHKTTRQTLQSFEIIKTAYDVIKKYPSSKKNQKSPKPQSLAIAQNMIQQRDIKIAILQEQVSHYEEQFMRWLYNARKRQITVEMLNQALPKNPINSTEE